MDKIRSKFGFTSGVLILLTQLYNSVDAQLPLQPRDEYTVDREYYKVNLGLTSIPTDIPADVVRVNIDWNSITRIPANIFSQLRRCEELDLDENKINQIEAGAFNGLNRIKVIYLYNNKLTELNSRTFQGAESVKTLSLLGNQITTIAGDTFVNLRNLTHLSLYNNSLKTLSPQIFRGLDSLVLLSLSYNDLTVLPANVFHGLHSLAFLFISYNSLTRLPAHIFKDIPRPLELDVSNLSFICDDALCWLRQEVLQRTIKWFALGGRPTCVNGVDWNTWNCTLPGK